MLASCQILVLYAAKYEDQQGCFYETNKCYDSLCRQSSFWIEAVPRGESGYSLSPRYAGHKNHALYGCSLHVGLHGRCWVSACWTITRRERVTSAHGRLERVLQADTQHLPLEGRHLCTMSCL